MDGIQHLISVIVPAYNIEAYLPRCLDSILGQTYPDLEVIVVDDGSKDGTSVKADEYAEKDSRVRIIHTENRGVSAARNRGIREASGDYIGFVDGDDEIEPDMYQLLLKNALEYDADISHCGYKMVFPSKEVSYYGTGELRLQDHQDGLRDLLRGYPVEPTLCDKLYRAELLKNVSFRSDIKYNEDLLLNVYLFDRASKSVFEDQTKYHYMLRKNSAATGRMGKKKMEDPVTVWNEILNCVKEDIELKALAESRLLHALTENVLISPEILNTEAHDYQKKCRKLLRERRAELVSAAGRAIAIKSFGAVHVPMLMRGILWCVRLAKGNLHPYEVK